MKTFKRKLFFVFTAIALVGMILPVHHHDEKCGYDPKTGNGCIYEEVDPLFEWDPEL